MNLLSQLSDKEYRACLQDVAGLMQEAKDYLWGQVYTGKVELDHVKVHHYLVDLSPYTEHRAAPPALLKLVARLFFEENRYQAAAKLYQQANDPEDYNTLGTIDFYSGYYASGNSWKDRQERVWSIFQGLEQRLRKTTADNVEALRDLMIAWDACFPTQEMMVMGPAYGKKGVICLGLPDGIFSLHPMLYLKKHLPDAVAKNWNVVLEGSEHEQEDCLLVDRVVPANEIRVDIIPAESASPDAQTGDSGKVVLVVWHPYLKELAQKGKSYEAMQSAICCVNTFLPQSARLLYVDCVALADREPPKKHSFPVPELPGQLEARNMAIDIPLDKVLERRRRKFTREPIHSTRPRADITHGETCMPELEEIYFRRNEEHLNTMQRYGTCGWFLTIPRKVCEGEFQEFRKVLEDTARTELGDAVQFVGWAEGTKNYYLDLITVHGRDVLECFRKSFAGVRECRSIRCSTFYWNSDLRTFNYTEELAKMTNAEFTGPVKELVGTNMRPALEKLVSATQWENPDIPKPNVQRDIQEGSVAYMDDPADLAKAYEDADAEEDDDTDADTSPNEDPYAQFSELFTKSPDDDEFTTMLKNMACMFAGRELEDPDDEDEEDDSDLEDLDDEASVFNAFQERMKDPKFAAVMKEVAKRAAAGPGGDDWDDEDVSLVPPWEYGSFMASHGGKAKSAQPRHVHNTKRKGLSRKKDKNKRKKKK